MKIGLVGGSGFVGNAIRRELIRLGHTPVMLTAPRIETPLRKPQDLASKASAMAKVSDLSTMVDLDVVVNAAGVARPDSELSDGLVGANSLMPAVLALEAEKAGVPRLVHISSAAVFGNTRVLDEQSKTSAKSPYAVSKALGDETLESLSAGLEIVIYRPTSVHGPERALTQSLVRFARSPLSTVAGKGERPTPQVLVENVANAAIFLATTAALPSHPVVHPWEGLTTAGLLRALSGKEPRHVPERVAAACVQFARRLARVHPSAGAQARRLEMLWFGQEQAGSWLLDAGYEPVASWSIRTRA